jgi:uncharacterized membrane protein YdfJ with MMPL/SSD domain
VGLDRLLAEEQLAGDLRVGKTVGDQLGDLELPLGERGHAGVLRRGGPAHLGAGAELAKLPPHLVAEAHYGLLTLAFEGEAIAAWLPLFLFVILFGLSMDYHVFILTRIREAFDRGMTTEDAVAHGIKSTAGVVTSAALVMVAVFSMFAMSSELQMQQMGIGLAAAVLIDATIIRGVLLPSAMKLLGDRNWWLPSRLGWLPQVTVEPDLEPARA